VTAPAGRFAAACLASAALLSCGGGQQAPAPVVVTSASSGPSHQVMGVGVGYAHTVAGAVEAAAVYAEAYTTPIFPVDQASERRRVAAYVVSSEQQTAAAQRISAIAGYESAYGVVTAHDHGLAAGARVYPLAMQVASYADASATVSLWATLVQYSSTVYRAVYATEDVALRWEAGDWKLVPSLLRLTLGPVPTVNQAATSTQPPAQVQWQPWGR